MQRLMRSLFLLSLTAAPLAVAGTAAPAPTSTESAVSSTPSDSTSARLDAIHENALLHAQVQDLEATVNGMRKTLQRIRDEEDARARVIGDPNVHPLWP
jgi:TolA-binding protein